MTPAEELELLEAELELLQLEQGAAAARPAGMGESDRARAEVPKKLPRSLGQRLLENPGKEALMYSLGQTPEAAAILRGFSQGATLGHADELAGLIESGVAKLSPKLAARMRKPVLGEEEAGAAQPQPGDYSAIRDRYRQLHEETQGDSPLLYGGGELAGAVALPGGTAKSVGGALAKGALSGAAYGGGASKADLTKGEVGEYLKDVGTGGATGAALGAGGKAGGDALAGWLKRKSLEQGRRFLLSGADQMANRKQLPDEVVEEALSSGAIPAFSTVEGASQRLGALTKQEGARYAQILAEMERRGVRGPDAEALADAIVKRGAEIEPTEFGKAVPGEYLDKATTLLGKAAGRKHLPLTQAEGLKRSAQREAHFERLNKGPLDEAKQEIASMLRGANEAAVDEAGRLSAPWSETRLLSEQFGPVKQRLGRLIEARKAAERGTQRSGARQGGTMADDALAVAELVGIDPLSGAALGAAKSFTRGGRMRSTEAALARALSRADLPQRPVSMSRAADPVRQAIIDALRRQEYETQEAP